MANRRIGWSVFDGFRHAVEGQSLSWGATDAWKAAIDVQFAPKREVVAALRARWDEELAAFGGDPHSRDWSRFRALRRHREEDWSDWVAQLIEDSETGWFARRLLGAIEGRTSTADYIGPDVQREIAREGFRADVVVLWGDATYTHIEVKVGDENLEKTCETSVKMKDLFRGVAEPRSDILCSSRNRERPGGGVRTASGVQDVRSNSHLDGCCLELAPCAASRSWRIANLASVGVCLRRRDRTGVARGEIRARRGAMGEWPLANGAGNGNQAIEAGRRGLNGEGARSGRVLS